MPTLKIGDKSVQVGDDFLKMSPEQQNATVEEISSSLGAPSNDPSTAISADNVVRSATHGIPILGGAMDNFAATMDAATQPVLGRGSNAPSYAERKAANLATETAHSKDFDAAHPIVSTGAELAGGAAAALPVMAAAPAAFGLTGTLPQMVVRGAVSNAAVGAADAAVRGNDVGHEAMVSGLAGGALPVAGRLIGKGVQAVRDLRNPAEIVPQNTIKVGDVDIPLTEGMATGDEAKQAAEEIARRGSAGPKAEAVAKDADAARMAATAEARDAIGSGLSADGRQLVDSPQQAGEAVSQGVADRAAAAKDAYQQSYKAAFDEPGSLPRAAFDDVGDTVNTRLSNPDDPIFIDPLLTPHANLALKDVSSSLKGEPSPAATLAQKADQTAFDNMLSMGIPADKARASLPNLTPAASDGTVNLQEVDQARKRLVALMTQAKKSGNASDVRAMGRVISGFDDHLENVLDKGLFSGSDKAIDNLRQARQQFSQYRNTFGSKGTGDFVGQKMQKILGNIDGQEASHDDIANYLMGSNGVNGTTQTKALASHLKMVLGTDSPEWTAVRQGLWKRLTESTDGRLAMGEQKIAERLHEFLNGKGKQLSEVIFTQKERDTMRSLAGAYARMIPVKGATNSSNTSHMLKKIVDKGMSSLLPLLGYSHGGVVGAGAVMGAGAAVKSFAQRKAARDARLLFYGRQPKRGGIVQSTALSRLAPGTIPALNDQP